MTIEKGSEIDTDIPEEFGPLKYSRGINNGRFPHNNALFIDDDIKVIIDPGSNPKILNNINNTNKIEIVVNSHYHYDHIRFNYIFKNSKILLHELDAALFQSLDHLAEGIGLPFLFDQEAVEQWKSQLRGGPPYFRGMYNVAYGKEWIWSTERVDGHLKDGFRYDFGEAEMEVIHTPGHSLGMCCFIFPRQRAAYVTDYDLTPFGPWYGSRHCSMEKLITSAEKLRSLDNIDWFITAHEMGIFKRQDFIEGLDKFLEIITDRDNRILEILNSSGRTMDELVRSSIVYDKRHVEDKFTYLWEWMHISNHLNRLISKGLVEEENHRYQLKQF
jgi:glyoxylase-like metal-dependent hydrolase (beta-lactamase superfamily II)